MEVKIFVKTKPAYNVFETGSYEPLDQFDDENIVVTFKGRDLTDLSKVYSDFSQTFSVPATTKNNRILQYYYDTSRQASTFASDKYKDCIIYVNNEPFKEGQISISDVKFKDQKPSTYSLNFTTNITSIKRIIGETKLSSIPFVKHLVNNNIIDYIRAFGETEVVYPLISTNRVWTLHDGGPNDITKNESSNTKYIKSSELRPAVRFSEVMDNVLNYFGLDVECSLFGGNVYYGGPYLDTPTKNLIYHNLFIWLNNETPINDNNRLLMMNHTQTIDNDYYTISTDAANKYITVTDKGYNWVPGEQSTKIVLRFNDIRDASSTQPLVGVPVKVNVFDYETGKQVFTETKTLPEPKDGVLNNLEFTVVLKAEENLKTQRFYYEIDSQSVFVCSLGIDVIVSKADNSQLLSIFSDTYTFPTAPVDLAQYFGDVKVIDFLSSFFKLFNVVVIGISGTKTQWLLPEEYPNGIYRDFTNYVKTDSHNMTPPALYNTIDFKHKDSTFLSNVEYKKNYGEEYGEQKVTSIDSNVSGEYKVDTIFQVLPFQDITNTRTRLNSSISTAYGFSQTQDGTTKYKPLATKDSLVLMYKKQYGTMITNGVYDNATGDNSSFFGVNMINTSGYTYRYAEFGTINQDLINFNKYAISNSSYKKNYNESLGFSILFDNDGNEIKRNLYTAYYKNSIDRLYKVNARLLNFEFILPSLEIGTLSIRDTIVIKGDLYSVEEINANLTTSEVKYKLLNYVPL